MSESKSEAHVKHPTFDGKDENWPFCKKKMESYLARLDLSDLLTGKISVPKDNAVGSDDKEKIEFDEKRSKNRKAAGALLNSIDSSTEEGKAAFFLIERLMLDITTLLAGRLTPAAKVGVDDNSLIVP